MLGRIHSIESFGTVDGPGVRFVVFLQGCPMRCAYCHNPDTWETGSGKPMTAEEIMESFRRNRSFYKDGGLTVTGGEPLLQIDFLLELFALAKKENVHTCIDTSGICFHASDHIWMERLDRLLSLTDLVMLDIKHIDPKLHKQLTGCSNENILRFAHYLDHKKIPVWIRHVVVPGLTLYREYLEGLGTFMASLNNVKALDVLPYHSMGKAKYRKLGIAYPLEDTRDATKEEALAARQLILAAYKRAKLAAEGDSSGRKTQKE